jgi:hypothetical protein
MGYAEFEMHANDRVEELLEAYAEARLDPAGPVLARIRANVMAQAAATAATYRLENPTPVPPAGSRFAWLQSRLPRRAFALGLTATLTLGTTAAVLAAPPGSPFYNARLVVEAALLPVQLDARLAAYEEHLVDRLNEAEAAARAGDPNAVAAALAAYQDDVASALDAVGDDAELLALLEAMLAKHTAVLEALEARVPEQAAIDNAIANSQKAIEKIKEKAAGKDNAGGGGTNNGNGRPSQAPNSQAGGPPDAQEKAGQP